MGFIEKYVLKREQPTYQEGSAEYEAARKAREERWAKADAENRAAFKGKGNKQQYSVGSVGYTHSNEAEDLKPTGAPLQRHIESHKYEPPNKDKSQAHKQTGQLSPKQKPQQQRASNQLTPSQQIAIAKLQLKAQQIAAKERRSQAAQARYYNAHPPADPNNWSNFDVNVARGSQNISNGIFALSDSISRYNNNIGAFSINFANVTDVKTLNGMADFNSRLADYDKKISRLFLKF